jgi:hypothetical protein
MALGLARGSDLIGSVPERHTESLREGIHNFPLPSVFRSSAFHNFGIQDSVLILLTNGFKT